MQVLTKFVDFLKLILCEYIVFLLAQVDNLTLGKFELILSSVKTTLFFNFKEVDKELPKRQTCIIFKLIQGYYLLQFKKSALFALRMFDLEVADSSFSMSPIWVN